MGILYNSLFQRQGVLLDLARDSLEVSRHGGSDVLVWDYFVASISMVRKKTKARWWSHENYVNLF